MNVNADNVITYWACSARCWQEGGPHDDSCRPTNYVRLDEGEWVGTDADRAVLDAAREVARVWVETEDDIGLALDALCDADDARREAQT